MRVGHISPVRTVSYLVLLVFYLDTFFFWLNPHLIAIRDYNRKLVFINSVKLRDCERFNEWSIKGQVLGWNRKAFRYKALVGIAYRPALLGESVIRVSQLFFCYVIGLNRKNKSVDLCDRIRVQCDWSSRALCLAHLKTNKIVRL